MNKKEAEAIAVKMLKDKVPAWAGDVTFSRYNKGVKFTPTAETKVRDAYFALVMDNQYTVPVIEVMYVEDRLAEQVF
jgi:hypothetical protein